MYINQTLQRLKLHIVIIIRIQRIRMLQEYLERRDTIIVTHMRGIRQIIVAIMFG